VERELSKQVCDLLDGANFAAVATLMEDGSPKVDTVWVGREGNLVLLASTDRTIKGQNLLRDDRVALSVTEYENPYHQVQIRGRVVEVRPDTELEGCDSMSKVYIGGPFPQRNHKGRVVFVIEPLVVRHYESGLRHNPNR
jgi:PPOX class probable F420-dependent enzyme